MNEDKQNQPEQEKPDAAGGASSGAGQDGQASDDGTGRMRRRRLAPGATPAPEPKPETPEPESAKNEVPAANEPAPSTTVRRRRTDAEEVAQAEAPSGSSSSLQQAGGVSRAVVMEESDEEEVTAGRRALRFVLILLVVGAGWWMLDELMTSMMTQAQKARSSQFLSEPQRRETENTAEGDALAKTLLQQIHANEIAKVVEAGKGYRSKFANHAGVLDALYLADAVVAVQEAATALEKLPMPEPESTSLSVEENISRLLGRMEKLKRLDDFQDDWGKAMSSIPYINPIYKKYTGESEASARLLVHWRIALTTLTRAREALTPPLPVYLQLIPMLETAQAQMPNPLVKQCIENAKLVWRAEYLLAHQKFTEADNSVQAMKTLPGIPEVKPSEGAPTLATDIYYRLLGRRDVVRQRLGAWSALVDAMDASRAAQKRGETQKAISVIDAALSKTDTANPLTADLVKTLRDRKRHYRLVLSNWNGALAAKANEQDLKGQLNAWATLQGSLDKKTDGYYANASRRELRALKREIRRRIAGHYAVLEKDNLNYKPIGAQMRRPENPRGPYAKEARVLAKLATEASKIKGIADLVPSWNLGDAADRQVMTSEAILAEHNDQAGRMWNLALLYRKRGALKMARECLERVVLLGDAPSNPWFASARKQLESDAKGSDK